MIAVCFADDCDGTGCACDCHDDETWGQEYDDDWSQP